MRNRLNLFLHRLAVEPLVHFVALGAMIFIAYYAMNTRTSGQNDRIEITTSDLERLRATSKQQWGQEPDALQMQDLVQSQVREEVLYREALASGLDRDDIIVRRRLAQKMEFLAHADVSTPTEAELRQYHAAHAAQYQQAASVDFEHVYFRSDRQGTPAAQAAQQAREALAQGAPVVADNFMLGNTFQAQDRDTLVRDFGSAFTDAVLQMGEKAWSEPLASAQGLHLVRVLRHVPTATLPLEAIRDRVTADMVNARVAAARDGAYQRLLARYTVVLPDGRMQVSAALTTAVQP